MIYGTKAVGQAQQPLDAGAVGRAVILSYKYPGLGLEDAHSSEF